MDGVNETCSDDVGAQYEDGVSEAAEGGSVTSEPADGSAPQDQASDTGQVDTFEPAASSELESINKQREELAPEKEKARDEALWEVAKALPYVGAVADGAQGVLAAKQDVSNGDYGKAVQDLQRAGAGIGMEILPSAADKFFEGSNCLEGVGGVFEAAKTIKDGYDVSEALNKYGAFVNQDEELRYRAEDIQMNQDPDATFKYVSVAGNDLSRTSGGLADADGNVLNPTQKPIDGRMIDQNGTAPATEAQRKTVEEICRRHGIKL